MRLQRRALASAWSGGSRRAGISNLPPLRAAGGGSGGGATGAHEGEEGLAGHYAAVSEHYQTAFFYSGEYEQWQVGPSGRCAAPLPPPPRKAQLRLPAAACWRGAALGGRPTVHHPLGTLSPFLLLRCVLIVLVRLRLLRRCSCLLCHACLLPHSCSRCWRICNQC